MTHNFCARAAHFAKEKLTTYFTFRKEISKCDKKAKIGNRITLLDTSLTTGNRGDEIIMRAIMGYIGPLLNGYEVRRISTHTQTSDNDLKFIETSSHVLLCGSNILSSMIEHYSNWVIRKEFIHLDNVVLISGGLYPWRGGWTHASTSTKFFYKHIFDRNVYHSVRDSQALHFLKSIGINNVLNTNCLTMWGLDEKCKLIPHNKSQQAIITITANENKTRIAADQYMINCVLRNYSQVYFWPQGDGDVEYMEKICKSDVKEKVTFIGKSLEEYTNILNLTELDYIGTRLHGGIYAMQNNKRSIVIAIDNRAREIHRDTGIPIIEYTDIYEKLEGMIQSEWITDITLNTKEIEQWKKSFEHMCRFSR